MLAARIHHDRMGTQRVRVAHVLTNLDIGGAQEWVMTCAEAADRSRFDTHIVTGSRASPMWRARLSAAHATTHLLPSLVWPVSPLRDVMAVSELTRLFRAERFDVVHTHMSKAGVLGRLAGRIARVPLVVHTAHGWSRAHSSNLAVRRAVVLCERLTFGLADSFVVASGYDAQIGSALLKRPPSRFVILPEGVPVPEEVADARVRGRARLGVDVSALVVGMVTRLVSNKRVPDLISAAASLRSTYPDVVVVVVGSGPEEGQLRQMIRALALDVRLIGAIPDAHWVFPALDVAVHTSDYEGLPRSVLHALAAGVPLVAQDAGGTAEVVLDGVTGWLVPPNDVPALAAAIIEACRDRAEALRRASAGRELVQRVYALEPAVRAYEGLYGDISSRGRARSR
jgi:glycosyltransferase involved in cell wall biosynthesis